MENSYGVVKIHFKSSKNAIAKSVDGSCWAGAKNRNGRVTTWIAHVTKSSPYETAQEAAQRTRQ
jgi:hypothetical protein